MQKSPTHKNDLVPGDARTTTYRKQLASPSGPPCHVNDNRRLFACSAADVTTAVAADSSLYTEGQNPVAGAKPSAANSSSPLNRVPAVGNT